MGAFRRAGFCCCCVLESISKWAGEVMKRTSNQWATILSGCGVDANTVLLWVPVFVNWCELEGKELACFLGQILHESGRLRRVEENLNYTTAARIRAVWPSRFKTEGDAEACVRNPVRLANTVYGNRMGNMDPGDGWKYRGRGLIQVTGRGNYWVVGRKLGVDLVAQPDLLAQPEWALRGALAWWAENIPKNTIGNVERITRMVNGGLAGLDDRVALTNTALAEVA